jgi:hypothetical protein
MSRLRYGAAATTIRVKVLLSSSRKGILRLKVHRHTAQSTTAGLGVAVSNRSGAGRHFIGAYFFLKPRRRGWSLDGHGARRQIEGIRAAARE